MLKNSTGLDRRKKILDQPYHIHIVMFIIFLKSKCVNFDGAETLTQHLESYVLLILAICRVWEASGGLTALQGKSGCHAVLLPVCSSYSFSWSSGSVSAGTTKLHYLPHLSYSTLTRLPHFHPSILYSMILKFDRPLFHVDSLMVLVTFKIH